MRELRPHQIKALNGLKTSFLAGKRRPMLQAPTGFGKTLLAAAIVGGAVKKGNRVCFTVPAISLIDQTVNSFFNEGLRDIGVIQADHWMTDPSKPIQVASVQTITRRGYPETDIVVVDEAHQSHKVIYQWMTDHPEVLFIGLSATPWTKGLGRHYDDLIIAATTQELIDDGYLSNFRVFAPSHPDLSGVKIVAGDYHEGQLSEAMDKPHLTADVVSTWLKLGENRPTLCFGVDCAHAKSLYRAFESAGVTVAYIDAYTNTIDRDRIGKAFNKGNIKVVCNVGTLTTGVDWDVRCLILARPTKSEMLYTQIIGRALRTANGKVDALILDHSDTTLNLGFVTDINHQTLDSRRAGQNVANIRERKQPTPIECSSCSYMKPASVHKCPNCGFAPERQPTIEVMEGSLQQVGGKPIVFDKGTKQRWWSGLLYYAQDKGFKQGWAANKYKDKFGVWPRSLLDSAKFPDDDVRNFIVSQQIRYAKSKKKLEKMVAAHGV